MKINKITTRKHPDQIIVRVILNTDRLKNKAKDIFYRLGSINEAVDNKIDKVTGSIVDLLT